MGEEEREKQEEGGLERLREMTARLENDLEDEEALDLLEKAVDEVEKRGKNLEEGES